jgi:hypothetical protein
MRNSISEFFITELEGWKESLAFYKQETERSSEWLKAIIQFNTVPGLARQVEHYLLDFEKASQQMADFGSRILSSQGRLLEHEDLDDSKKDTYLLNQKQLRAEMQEIEKKFLELKYESDAFVADALVVQQQKPDA